MRTNNDISYVFLSNYFNHHQSTLSKEMHKQSSGKYRFIETSDKINPWKAIDVTGTEFEDYVIKSYTNAKSHKQCQDLINNADVVITGSAPYDMIHTRLKEGKLTFRYSERIYKRGYEWHKYPMRLYRHYQQNGKYKNFYLLCASGYTSADYAKTFTFIDKAYKWGYFPEVKVYYDVNDLIASKDKRTILWAGSYIKLKHPELPIVIAKRLREEGYNFKINMIGLGEMEEELRDMINEYSLENHVFMLGSMKSEEVRSYMEQAGIYLFTSNFNEGWGAVLNESMNSGCAVVASHAIGSVPFLIKDGSNGMIYKNDDFNHLYSKVKYLLDNKNVQASLGLQAYNTMVNDWNARVAVERLIKLSQTILSGVQKPDLYEEGVCSKSEILKNNWM